MVHAIDCGLDHARKQTFPVVYGPDWNLTRTDQSRPPCAEVMESYKNEVDDKSATFDSEEDDMDDDSELDPKVLLGRKIYNYNKQVDAELFRLQLKEVCNE